eukprot:scaffold46261_cov55-Phaeocystis_antarctica.AAC.1
MKNYLTYRVASSLTLALFFLISACAFNPQARSLVITHVLQRPSYHLRLRLQPAGTFPSYHPCGSALPIPACAFNFPQVEYSSKTYIVSDGELAARLHDHVQRHLHDHGGVGQRVRIQDAQVVEPL